MTRLIDADALKEQVESHVVSMSVCLSMDEHYGKVTMREDCLQDIADAPTIDAIPVAWMEAQIRPYTGDVSDIGKSARNGTIKDLIRRWQKEQEAKHERPDTPEDQS